MYDRICKVGLGCFIIILFMPFICIFLLCSHEILIYKYGIWEEGKIIETRPTISTDSFLSPRIIETPIKIKMNDGAILTRAIRDKTDLFVGQTVYVKYFKKGNNKYWLNKIKFN